jgi:hypothetical protein
MHLTAGLGWIRGYPTGVRGGRVRWVSVPAPGTGRPVETVTVDRDRLREATLTLRKLVGRHRGSLARIVGDVAAWGDGVERRLEALKAVIHHGAPLPDAAPLLDPAAPAVRRSAKRTAAAWPALTPLLDAAAWIHTGDGRGLGKAIRFVEGRAVGLAELVGRPAPAGSDAGPSGFDGALGLVDLVVADGEPRAAAPARVLCDPRAFTVPCAPHHRASEAVQQLFRKKQRRPLLVWPARPAPELGPAILQLLPRLALLPDGPRRRALRLLGLCTPRGALNRWERWWRSADRARAAVERRLLPALPEAGRVHELRRHHATLRRLERQVPPAVPMQLLCEQLLALHQPGGDDRFLRELERGVAAMPEAQGPHGLRSGFFLHWVALFRDRPRASALLRRAMSQTRRLVRKGRFPERILFLWAHIADARLPAAWEVSRAPEGLVVQGHVPAAQLPRLYGLVEAAGWGGRAHAPLPIHQHERWSAALLLLPHCASVDDTVRFLRALVEAKLERQAADLNATVTGALVACAAGDPERWTALVQWADDADYDDLEQLPALVQHTGQPELIGDWLLAGEGKRVLAVASRLALVRALGAGRRVRLAGARGGTKAPAAKRTAEWMRRYPERLRPVLRELAVVSPDAEAQAGRVLGAAYPDPAGLEREIAGLQERVALAVPGQAGVGGRVGPRRRARHRGEGRCAPPARLGGRSPARPAAGAARRAGAGVSHARLHPRGAAVGAAPVGSARAPRQSALGAGDGAARAAPGQVDRRAAAAGGGGAGRHHRRGAAERRPARGVPHGRAVRDLPESRRLQLLLGRRQRRRPEQARALRLRRRGQDHRPLPARAQHRRHAPHLPCLRA